MTRGPNHFRQADVARAIAAAKSAGLPIARIEIDPLTGKIVVIVGEPSKGEPAVEPSTGPEILAPVQRMRKQRNR